MVWLIRLLFQGNSKPEDNFGRRLIMRYYFILLLSTTIFCTSELDVVQQDLKIVQSGEDVNLTCNFSEFLESTAWFKQTAEGKSLKIVSLHFKQPTWNKDFEKMNRFNVTKGDKHFTLIILKTKPSDSATYYCVAASNWKIGMGAGTRLVVRDAAVAHRTLQQSLIDTLHPGDSVNLQCSIFSESCAGEHSVYWFRQSLGDSQGVLYTKGERNGQCKNSSESQTQSCVYNLLKSNISDSDAGIYYCAVAACGEILFGEGTQLYFRESGVNTTLLVLGISNIIFFTLTVFLAIKLCQNPNKESQGEDILSYAAHNSFIANGLKVKITQEHSLVTYSMYSERMPIIAKQK